MKHAVKLVIWDLDDTFWQGTLSEQGIMYNNENHRIVQELNKRGILTSICSKNDYIKVKEVLTEYDIWNFFVFPKIEWKPKGMQVKSLIDEMQLRSENVLFIDDNYLNLQEVKFFNKEISVMHASEIYSLLDHPCLIGAPDPYLERLQKYKLMEAKQKDKKEIAMDNTEFLRYSNIRVEIYTDCINEIERIHELITRTNQLNFTKNCCSKEELTDDLKRDDIEAGYLVVHDRYGDYGVTGFYMIENNQLKHFLFSCRILNMYIETWLYKQLNYPELKIKGEVAVELNSLQNIDFINCEIKLIPNEQETIHCNRKVLMVGGCDLEQSAFYLNSKSLSTDFNYVNTKGIFVNKDHTCMLRQLYEPNTEMELLMQKMQLWDKYGIYLKIHDTWDTLIYSPLVDYSRGLYRHYKTGFILPFDSFNMDWTNPILSADLPVHLKEMPVEWFKVLQEEFEFLGAIQEQDFRLNLEWLCNLYKDRKIIFVNGSEINIHSPHPWEKEMYKRHQAMNKILKSVVDQYENTDLVNINDFVNSPQQHTDSIRHYTRLVYKQISSEITKKINAAKISIHLENNWMYHFKILLHKLELKFLYIKYQTLKMH